MAQEIHVAGFKSFLNSINKIDKNKLINCYFVGGKDKSGISWCPDCVETDPYVEAALKKYGIKDSVFIFVEVGGREYWKDIHNPFRKDRRINLSVIPTIVRWNSYQRLEGKYYISKDDLLEMFFTDDLDS